MSQNEKIEKTQQSILQKMFERLFGLFSILSYSWTKSAPLVSALQLHWLVHDQGFLNLLKKRFFAFLGQCHFSWDVFVTKSTLIPCYRLCMEAEEAVKL
jgi:hypothetical protein